MKKTEKQQTKIAIIKDLTLSSKQRQYMKVLRLKVILLLEVSSRFSQISVPSISVAVLA